MRRFLMQMAVLALVLGGATQFLSAAARKPNVIMILADDLGYGDLGCYGQEKIRTPNIDRLAREGMRFTQFYAGSSQGTPSRGALFTGRHAGHATIRGGGDVPLEGAEYTLSKMFRYAGYRADGIGRWGLGLSGTSGSPKSQGFNQWVGFLSNAESHDYFPERIWRWDSRENWDSHVGLHNREYVQEVFNRAAQNSIRINADFQFFLYLPFTIPHANPALKDRGMQVPSDSPYSAEDWPQPEKNKAAMISRLDQSVGAIRNWLQQYRLENDTIILVTSDNGPHAEGGVDPVFFDSSGSLRGGKGELYEGGLRVPMIVWWPGHVKAGAVSDQLWTMWDVLPTLADVVGATDVPEDLDGISMLPTWLGEKQTNQHEVLYWELHEPVFQQALRTNQWKAVQPGSDQPLELYDLSADPAEENNVASMHPMLSAAMIERMAAEHTPSARWPVESDEGVRPKANTPGADGGAGAGELRLPVPGGNG